MATITAPTLERLIKEARIMLNQKDSSNSTWDDADLTSFINDGVKLYYQEIVDRAEGQFDTQTTLDITGGVESVTLPSDCFVVKALYKVETTRNQILAYSNNLTEGYVTQQVGGNPETYEPSYYFRGNSIILRPIPDFTQAAGLVLEYTRFPETMITGGDHLTSGISPVFKELIVMYAVYKAKVQESLVSGTDTSALARQLLSDIYAKFRETVGLRSKYPTSIKPFNP